MLEQDLKEQLGQYLTRLTGDVEITAFVDDSAESRQMLELLADIRAVSSRVSVSEKRDAKERAPSFALARPGEAPRIRFAGLPLGHEFTSLVLALLQVGGYPPKVEPEVIEQVKALDGDFEFRTY
ncbi:MAG TPA: hypothetical protein VN645_09285, partial [Steroidobacteraceae bacterium]|nr:hypothetical protein [Steroidobacteraceae bacterium]